MTSSHPTLTLPASYTFGATGLPGAHARRVGAMMSEESLRILLNQGLIKRADGGPFGGYRTTKLGQWFLDRLRGQGTCPDHPDPAQDPSDLEPGEKVVIQVGDIVVLACVLLGPTIYDKVFESGGLLGSKKRASNALLVMGIAASHAIRHGVSELERRLTWSWDVGVSPRTNEVYRQVLEGKLNSIDDTVFRGQVRELIEAASMVCPLRLIDAPGEGAAPGGPRFSLLG